MLHSPVKMAVGPLTAWLKTSSLGLNPTLSWATLHITNYSQGRPSSLQHNKISTFLLNSDETFQEPPESMDGKHENFFVWL